MNLVGWHHSLRPIFLLALISDFSVGESSFLRINILVCLLFLPKVWPLIKSFVPFIALLQVISLLGVISSGTSIYDIIYTFFIWASLLQIAAFVYLALDLGQEKDPSSSSLDPILILVWLLVIIGLLQYAFGSPRPPFVFYETNYIAFWLPPLLLLSFLRSYASCDPGRPPATIYYRTIARMTFPALILLALSQSLSLFASLLMILIASLLVFVYSPVRRLITRFSIATSFSRFLLLMIIVGCFLCLLIFSNTAGILSLRLNHVLANPDSLVWLSGLRYLTYEAARNYFSSLELLPRTIGGFFALVRDYPILTPEGNIATIPLSGIYALLLQHGLLGMSLVLFQSFFLLRRILLKMPGLFSAFFVYTIVMASLAISVLTNLTYAGVLVFAGISFAAMKQSIKLSVHRPNLNGPC